MKHERSWKDLAEARTTAERLTTESQAATKQWHDQREHASIVADLTQISETEHLLKKSQAEAAAEVSKAKALADEAKQQRTKREPVWDQATSLDTESQVVQTQLKKAIDVYRELQDEAKKVASHREAAEKALAAHNEAAQALEAWLKQNVADAELAESLPKLRVAVREWRTAFEKLAEGRKRHAEAQTLNQKITEAETQAAALAKKAAESTAKVKTDRVELERLAKALEAQREVTRQAELVAGFDEHRHDLKPGEPCKLCGALEHPYATSGANFESQLQTARKLLTTLDKQCEKANRDLATLERDLAKVEAEAGAETKRVAEMKKRGADLEAPADAVLEQWSDEEERKKNAVESSSVAPQLRDRPVAAQLDYFASPNDAERELDALDKRSGVFAKKKQEAAQKLSERQKLEGEIQLAKQEEAAKTKRLDELKAEGVMLRGKSDELKAKLNELLGGKSLSEDRQQHEARVSTAEKSWRDAEAKLNALQTQITATKAKLEQLEDRRTPFEGQAVLSMEALSELEAKAKRLNDDFATKRTEVGSLEQQVKNR
jgi:exonuclease SbcC